MVAALYEAVPCCAVLYCAAGPGVMLWQQLQKLKPGKVQAGHPPTGAAADIQPADVHLHTPGIRMQMTTKTIPGQIGCGKTCRYIMSADIEAP